MGTQAQGGVPGAVTVRAGQVVAADGGCFWASLLEAASGTGDVIADLADTVSVSGQALEIMAYVAGCVRAGRRRFAIIADGPVRGAAEAASGQAALDVASSSGELAALWGAGR